MTTSARGAAIGLAVVGLIASGLPLAQFAAPAAVAQQAPSVDRAVSQIVNDANATTSQQAQQIVALSAGADGYAEALVSAAIVNGVPYDELLDAAATMSRVPEATRIKMIAALLRALPLDSGDTPQSLVGRATQKLVNDPRLSQQSVAEGVRVMSQGAATAVFDPSPTADPLSNGVAVGAVVDAIVMNAIDEITGEPTEISHAVASAAVRGAATAAPSTVDSIAAQALGAVERLNKAGGAKVVYVNPTNGAIVPASSVFAVAALSGVQMGAPAPGSQSPADPVAHTAEALSQVITDGDELASVFTALAELSAGAYTKETLRERTETAAVSEGALSTASIVEAQPLTTTGGGLSGLPIVVIEELVASSGLGSSEAQDNAPSEN